MKKMMKMIVTALVFALITGSMLTANARILFQDDIFEDVDSEGIKLNADDTAPVDEDVTIQFGNDGTDGVIIWDDALSELNIGDGTSGVSIDSDTWDITEGGVASGFTGITSTGPINFTGATSLGIPTTATDPATCTEGDIFYNTTLDELRVCSATNTWESATEPLDFEDIYANDADNTLTASSDFTIDAQGLNLQGNALEIDVTTTGALDLNSGAFTLDASTVGITSTTGDVTISSADDLIFDDAQLTGIVQLTDAATDWALSLPYNGIIDNINAFTSTANGQGASLIGIEDSGGNFTATTVEGALIELEGSISAAGTESEQLKFYPEYGDTVYDHGSNKGKLEALVDPSEGNMYQWTTTKNTPQYMITKTRAELPADYVDGKNLTLRYSTATALTADNTVSLELYNVTNSQSCGTVAAAASTSWTTMTLAEATIEGNCTGATALNIGDIIEIRVTMMADDGSNGEAYTGYVDYDYTR